LYKATFTRRKRCFGAYQPVAIAATLTGRAIRLHRTIRDVLENNQSGSTLKIDLEDGDGGYASTLDKFWRVYERGGEHASNVGRESGVSCKQIIAYFCPRYQR
jgi:hypothetical protein